MSSFDEIEPTKLYTTVEVADMLETSPRQVRRWANAGYFGEVERLSPAPGSKRKISGQSIIEFEQKRRNE